MGYVLRYPDGLYNRGQGWPVDLKRATVYRTFEKAQAAATYFVDCEIVEVAAAEQPREAEAAK